MAQLPQDLRRALLGFLTSSSDVRADVIRRLHERGEDALVDTLVELEADRSLRRQAVQVLELAELDAIQRKARKLAPPAMQHRPHLYLPRRQAPSGSARALGPPLGRVGLPLLPP